MTGEFSSFHQGGVRGFLHEPEEPSGNALGLTHGASGNATAKLLVKVAQCFAAAGFVVLRFDLPFRQSRPSGPPGFHAAKADRENIGEAADVLRKLSGGRVFMGGQSYGGRMTSMQAAEHPENVDGLLLLSYPLHPPGKTTLRTDHFPALHVSALFAQGVRDPFGTPDEIRSAVAAIPASTEVVAIEGAGHDLKGGAFDVAALLVEPFRRLMNGRV